VIPQNAFFGIERLRGEEILKNRDSVEQILKAPENCELMAVVALGHTDEKGRKGSRKPLREVMLERK